MHGVSLLITLFNVLIAAAVVYDFYVHNAAMLLCVYRAMIIN